MLEILNQKTEKVLFQKFKSQEKYTSINSNLSAFKNKANELFGKSFDDFASKLSKIKLGHIGSEADYISLKKQIVKLVRSLDLSDANKKELSYLISYYTYIPIVKPKTISIDLSERCNLECKICHQWKDRNPNKKVGLRDVKKVFDELAIFSPNTLVEFSGQEPLLKKDLLMKVLQYGTHKNITMAINTNGILLKYFDLDKLLRFKLNHITISIDGLRDTHNYIRSSKNAFDQSIEAIRLLVSKKRQLKIAKPTISVTSVITDLNYKELLMLHDFLRELGVDTLNLNPFTLDNSYFFKKDATYENNEFWVSDSDALGTVLDEIIRRKKTGLRPYITNSESQLKMIPAYFKRKGQYHKRICLAGLNYFHITNFGEITVCGKGPKLNIRDYDLETIWNNYNFLKTRKAVQECTTPCLNNCFELR